MNGGLEGPGPSDRPQPNGLRNRAGVRVEAADDDSERRRAVLSAIVTNEPDALAEVTGVFARQNVCIERIVGEPTSDERHFQIRIVVEPPHPGVGRITALLERLYPVASVEECNHISPEQFTESIDES